MRLHTSHVIRTCVYIMRVSRVNDLVMVVYTLEEESVPRDQDREEHQIEKINE